MAYSREVADYVLAEMAAGRTLREICRTRRADDPTFPAESTVRLWSVEDVDGFAARYVHAREALAWHWADEILEAADDGSNDWIERENQRTGRKEVALDREHVQRSQLRVDSRKWLLSKLVPKQFGDRIATQALDRHGEPTDPPAPVMIDLAAALAGWKPKDGE